MNAKIFLVIYFILNSCGMKPDSDQLNLVMSSDPKSLDPAYATDVNTGRLCALLYDNLVRFGSGREIIPGLAKKWRISDNGLEYLFTLKDSIFFQSGDQLECLDVKNSFERILDPKIKSHRKWLFKHVIGVSEVSNTNTDIKGFTCLDSKNFQINLYKAFTPFLSFLAMPSASIIKILDQGEITGTGPWKLDEWIHDGHILFSKNSDYFDKVPKIKRLKIRILPEILPKTAEFITGYLDIMEVPESEFSIWANDSNWQKSIKYQDDLNIFYLGLNCSRPPFNKLKVRQAMNYGIDVESIIKNIKNGNASRASGPIPPDLLKFNFNTKYSYNQDKAKKLLYESGYESGFKVELWQSQSSQLLYVTEAIQAQLKKIGIEVEIIRNDWNLFSQSIQQGKPDMYYRSWYADYPNAENFLAPLFESSISNKRWNRYSNLIVDSLINKIQLTIEDSLREEYTKQASQIIIDDAPWVFLWHTRTPYIFQSNIKNWKPSLMFNAEKYTMVTKK